MCLSIFFILKHSRVFKITKRLIVSAFLSMSIACVCVNVEHFLFWGNQLLVASCATLGGKEKEK